MKQYTPAQVLRLAEYIRHRHRISSSGGVFYLEFPLPTEQINDGIKRPSKTPNHIYSIKVDAQEGISAKSPLYFFSCSAEGEIKVEDAAQMPLAADLFAFLFDLARA